MAVTQTEAATPLNQTARELDTSASAEGYERGGRDGISLSPNEFEKVLATAAKAAEEATEDVLGGPIQGGFGQESNPPVTDELQAKAEEVYITVYRSTYYNEVSDKLEEKADKAEAKSDKFEARASEVSDPDRAKILEQRAEINQERSEFLREESDHAEEISQAIEVGGETLENLEKAIPTRMIERAAFFEERAADLTELSELVRETGNTVWADKILARADVSSEQSQELTSQSERLIELNPGYFDDPSAEAGDLWLSNDAVAAIQTELNETEEFAASVVDSARELSEGEEEAIREVALELGADPNDMAFLDFLIQEAGIKIVFVDNMVANNNAFGAFGGEASIPESEGLGILMDSHFVDENFDDGVSGENEVSAQGGEVFLHEATHILQSFGIIDFSGEVGDGNPLPELAAGETINELDGEDQAVVVEMMASDFIEDTAVLGELAEQDEQDDLAYQQTQSETA